MLVFATGACSQDGGVTSTPTPPPSATPVSATGLTPGPGDTEAPPVTGRIAFTAADGSIFTARRDGSDRLRVSPETFAAGKTVLTPLYAWPVWSPDGRHLLFTSIVGERFGETGTALIKTPAATGLPHNRLYVDVPGTTGIGGIAHYAAWRPDAEFVVMIANVGDGLSTFMLDSEAGFTGQGVSNGSPVYLSWSADSRFLLTHTDERLVLHEFLADGSRAGRTVIGSGSIAYRAPQFSPVSNEYLYVDIADGVWSLYVGAPGVTEPERLPEADTSMAFTWSPDGQRIAVSSGPSSGRHERLEVIGRDGSGTGVALEEQVLAFWWSPDGEKLLVTLRSEGGAAGEVRLAVLETGSGAVKDLGVMRASGETRFMIEFFDQYATTHRVWSPDSRYVVLAGTLSGEPVEDAGGTGPGSPESSEGLVPHVWVIDTHGAEAPVSLGGGGFGAWSPG